LPALVLKQDIVEVAEAPGELRFRLPVPREQEMPVPVEEETDADNVIVPVKPDRLETVITVLPELPETIVEEGELEEIAKSPTLSVTTARCETLPLVAFTIRLYVPGSAEDEAETVMAAKTDPPGDKETLF
jgi:hypothetical protein